MQHFKLAGSTISPVVPVTPAHYSAQSGEFHYTEYHYRSFPRILE
jgi:hypothetical protein